MGRRSVLIALSIGLGAAAPGQVTVELELRGALEVAVEHHGIAPRDRVVLPAGTRLPFGTTRLLTARSNTCTAEAVLGATSSMGSAVATAEFAAHLPTRTTAHSADAATSADLVARFRAPAGTRGALVVSLDAAGSRGAGLLGDVFLDIGDDGVFDYAIGGRCGCRQLREFPLTVGAEGAVVRVLHVGSGLGSNAASCDYRTDLILAFVPDTTAIVPFASGCHRLDYLRWGNGAASIDFVRAPGDELRFVAVGVPLAAAQTSPASPVACVPHLQVATTVLVPGQRWWFVPPQLPPGVTVALQGFVFTRTGVLPTDSWLVPG